MGTECPRVPTHVDIILSLTFVNPSQPRGYVLSSISYRINQCAQFLLKCLNVYFERRLSTSTFTEDADLIGLNSTFPTHAEVDIVIKTIYV